jgi:hypothetical protein
VFLYSFTSLHSGANEADMLSAPVSDDYTVFGVNSDGVGFQEAKVTNRSRSRCFCGELRVKQRAPNFYTS